MGILCKVSWFGSGLHAVTSMDVREYPNRFAVLFRLFIGFGVILGILCNFSCGSAVGLDQDFML